MVRGTPIFIPVGDAKHHQDYPPCPPDDSVGYCACNGACLGACEPAFDAMYACYVANCSSECM
jgi:hypothetical protein